MKFDPPLVPARLVRRYKRFLADVTLQDGTTVTAHVANPGKMTGMAEPNSPIWLQHSDNPKRKLAWSWKLTETHGARVGVDTGLANRLVEEGLRAGRIAELTGYSNVRREVRYGDNSRIDFHLSGPQDAWVEVKSVTLSRRSGLAEFPDTKTARGTKHLAELAKLAQAGQRAVLVYLVQRDDCDQVCVAADIDPGYAKAYAMARQAGLEVLAYRVTMSDCEITLAEPCTVAE